MTTTRNVVQIVDYRRAVQHDPAVSAHEAMESATNDAAYDAATDRLEMARPTTLQGVLAKIRLAKNTVSDAAEGDDVSAEKWEAVLASLDSAAMALQAFTLRTAG